MSKATKPQETAEQRFIRIATRRVNKALKDISLIGNLSGSGYAYSDGQIKQLFQAIDAEVEKCKQRFRPKTKTEAQAFSFDNQAVAPEPEMKELPEPMPTLLNKGKAAA